MRTASFQSSLKWAILLCLVALAIMLPTLAMAQTQATVSINAGGSATGSFVADQYFSGGSTYTNTRTIDTSQITANPPPAAIFSTERYGAMTYTIPNRSGAQTVTLYFAETYVTAAGQRLFNVSINGATVLSSFDIYASAGGVDRAIARTFNTTANASGQVVIQFIAGTQNPKINGISVAGSGANPTTVPPTGVPPTGVPPTSVPPTSVPPTSVPPAGVSINSGGSATGSFVADQYFSGGSTYTNTATIDMSQITSNPPPAAVFNTERYGAMTYTIPNRSGAQTVTLYFAETYVTAAGQRLFSVSINGSTVLSSFDIYASAGGANRAIARTFNTTANASGQVVIQFISGTENPKINGITVAGGSVSGFTLTVNKAGSGSGTVSSNPAGISCGSTCSASFAGGASVTLTATATSGSTFGGWSGACSGTGNCTVTMNASQTVTATFNGGSGDTRPSAGCGKTRTLQNGTITIQSGGVNRTYILRAPDNYSNTRPYRLIVGYHWLNGSAQNVASENYYRLFPLSNNSTIFVAPQGLDAGWANTNNRDLNLTDAILTQLQNDLCIDLNRIWATGFSYGAGMSYAIACARANVFRGVALYAGAQLSGCSGGTTAIAYFATHGISDSVLNISQGRTLRDRFVSNNSCTAQNPPEPSSGSGTHICTSYQNCSAGHPVRWCAFDGDHNANQTDRGQSTSWIPGEVWSFISSVDGGQ